MLLLFTCRCSYVYFETVDKTDAATGKLREEMILVCNFLRKDLMHANEFVRGCALRFVAKLKEFELLEPLVKPIKENLDHRHSYVRRNAVLALHNAYRVSETLCVDAPEIMERQLKVCCALVNFLPVFCNICPCLLYTSPSPRDRQKSRMPSSA